MNMGMDDGCVGNFNGFDRPLLEKIVNEINGDREFPAFEISDEAYDMGGGRLLGMIAVNGLDGLEEGDVRSLYDRLSWQRKRINDNGS